MCLTRRRYAISASSPDGGTDSAMRTLTCRPKRLSSAQTPSIRTRSRSSRCASVPTSTTSSPSRSASTTAKPVSSAAKRSRRTTTSPSNAAPGSPSIIRRPTVQRRSGGSEANARFGAVATQCRNWCKPSESLVGVTLTIATWNLENLFLPGTESGPPDQATYDRKLASLAKLIDQIAPDVLAVQEVGDERAFEDLLSALAGEWQSRLSPDADDRGIRVAFLSKLPFEDLERIRAFPAGTDPVRLEDDGTTTNQMGRGALRVRVAGIDLITAHLKSKLLTYEGGRFQPRDEDERARYIGYALDLRAQEAITLRHHVTALLAERRTVVVLGDLNDEPAAATTQILLGPPGSEFKTGGFDVPDEGDAQRLWNLAPMLPEGHAFSRIFNGRRELIDHILVSYALTMRLESADTGPADLPSIAGPRPASGGSDHAPVFARFRDT